MVEISFYYFCDFVGSGLGYQFVEFPYVLLTSVLFQAAIFLHAFSIQQVLTLKKPDTNIPVG